MTDTEALDKAVAAILIAWERVIGVTVETTREPVTASIVNGGERYEHQPITRQRVILEMRVDSAPQPAEHAKLTFCE